MTVLSMPRHPVTSKALQMARTWCAGYVIDGAPALWHAVRVALTLGEHIPDATPELVAAALLHDAPKFAPANEDLDTMLTAQLGPSIARVVRAIEREHQALSLQAEPAVPIDDLATLYVSAADKIVSLTSILRRAATANDPGSYWQTRGPFLALVPYFRLFSTLAGPHLPATMAAELERLVTTAELARCRAGLPPQGATAASRAPI